jgi:MFS family permease
MASSFLGMFIGAAAFGRIADRIGRRRAFLLNLVWFSVCSLLAAVAPSPALLVAARFLAGIGIGAEYPVADSYLSDVLPKAHRGRLAAWAYTCSFLAVPVLGFLALGLSGRTVLGIDGWRGVRRADATRTTRVPALARSAGPLRGGAGRPRHIRGRQCGRAGTNRRVHLAERAPRDGQSRCAA